MEPPAGVEETFLTERQAEVLGLRAEGLTQREIADRLGTSVANISGIESAARRNVATAARTLDLAALLECAIRFTAPAGTDLRTLVDEIYERGDEAGLRVDYAEPDLTARLHGVLDERIEARALTDAVDVGLTSEGEVIAFPSATTADWRERLADRGR